MPEWSKGADLSSAIVRCVGSNPTGCIFKRDIAGKEREVTQERGVAKK